MKIDNLISFEINTEGDDLKVKYHWHNLDGFTRVLKTPDDYERVANQLIELSTMVIKKGSEKGRLKNPKSSGMKCIECQSTMEVVFYFDTGSNGYDDNFTYAYRVWHCYDCLLICRENLCHNEGVCWIKRTDKHGERHD